MEQHKLFCLKTDNINEEFKKELTEKAKKEATNRIKESDYFFLLTFKEDENHKDLASAISALVINPLYSLIAFLTARFLSTRD